MGEFIDEIEFSDHRAEKEEKVAQAKIVYDMELRKTRIAAAINDDPDKPALKAPKLSVWGGITKQIGAAKDKIDQRMGDDSRMILHKMSQNNKFFLFEDK